VGYGQTRTPLRHRKSGEQQLPTYGWAHRCSPRPASQYRSGLVPAGTTNAAVGTEPST